MEKEEDSVFIYFGFFSFACVIRRGSWRVFWILLIKVIVPTISSDEDRVINIECVHGLKASIPMADNAGGSPIVYMG